MSSDVGSAPQAISPAPPTDAESGAARAAMPGPGPWETPDEFIAILRDTLPFDATDDELTQAGARSLHKSSVTSFDGSHLKILVARTQTSARPSPTLFYLHGGGMVSGTPRTGLAEVVAMGRSVGAQVIAVDYRLAPEHPDPAPLEDCYAAFCEVLKSAVDLGIDLDRVVIVGSSAGGCLAAGVALLARDRSGPIAAGLMLLNPMLDDRNGSVSAHQMAGLDTWDIRGNAVGWGALLGERRAGPDVSIYSAPARANDLAGLPAVLVDVGSAETLRDESVAFAAQIWSDGGVAELHVWPGGFHGYEFVAPHSRLAQETWTARIGWLRRIVAE